MEKMLPFGKELGTTGQPQGTSWRRTVDQDAKLINQTWASLEELPKIEGFGN